MDANVRNDVSGLPGPRLPRGRRRTGLHIHYLHRQGTGTTVDPVMAWNPHLNYNDNRGYVNTRITKDAMTQDFRVLNYVTTPGPPFRRRPPFAIQDGVPGLVPK